VLHSKQALQWLQVDVTCVVVTGEARVSNPCQILGWLIQSNHDQGDCVDAMALMGDDNDDDETVVPVVGDKFTDNSSCY
jgi:hypothetical protein